MWFMRQVESLLTELRDDTRLVLKELKSIRRLVAKVAVTPPGPLAVRTSGNNPGSPDMKYAVTLPQLSPEEAAEYNSTPRELVRRVFTDPQGRTFDIDLDASLAGAVERQFFAKKGDSVTVSLHNVDDDGNESTKSSRSFTAVDDIPPPAPGELSIKTISEEDEPTA